MTEIHDRLRLARDLAGLTQGQVAAYEGVSKSYLSKLEGGSNTPNVWPLLAALARRYGVSADYILGLTDTPQPITKKELPQDMRELWEIYGQLSPIHQAIVDIVSSALILAQDDHQRQTHVRVLRGLIDAIEQEREVITSNGV